MRYVNINDPGTWRPYKPGLCDNCQAGCCHMPSEVTVEDLLRLEVLEIDDWENSQKRAVQNLKKQGFISSYRDKTGLFILGQKGDRSCVFLDANARCTVYDKRPETCRNFPKVSSRSNFCPAEPKPQKMQKNS